MVRCGRYLEIIRDEKLVENAREVGTLFLQKLRLRQPVIRQKAL